MSYQVLARKWRPQQFGQLVGQDHVKSALIHALNNDRLHHAYLFTGTRGVGKTTIARIFAKSLNCELGVTSTPCGKCSACVEIDKGFFVDLLEIDAASRTKVEDTRDLLDNVQYAPTRGRYKVYLIDEVHMLSRHSFNALLKTLEEPPPHVKFLLATTDPQKLPITVLSRCLQFSLKALSQTQIKDHLRRILQHEHIQAEDEALALLARAAKGSLRDSLSLTDQAIAQTNGHIQLGPVREMLGYLEQSWAELLLQDVLNRDVQAMQTHLGQLCQAHSHFGHVLDDMLSLLHLAALSQFQLSASELALTESAFVRAVAKQFAPEAIQLYYQLLISGKKELPYAPDPRIGLEMTLLRAIAFVPVAAHDTPSPVQSARAAALAAASVPTEPAASVGHSAQLTAVAAGVASKPVLAEATPPAPAALSQQTPAPAAPSGDSPAFDAIPYDSAPYDQSQSEHHQSEYQQYEYQQAEHNPSASPSQQGSQAAALADNSAVSSELRDGSSAASTAAEQAIDPVTARILARRGMPAMGAPDLVKKTESAPAPQLVAPQPKPLAPPAVVTTSQPSTATSLTHDSRSLDSRSLDSLTLDDVPPWQTPAEATASRELAQQIAQQVTQQLVAPQAPQATPEMQALVQTPDLAPSAGLTDATAGVSNAESSIAVPNPTRPSLTPVAAVGAPADDVATVAPHEPRVEAESLLQHPNASAEPASQGLASFTPQMEATGDTEELDDELELPSMPMAPLSSDEDEDAIEVVGSFDWQWQAPQAQPIRHALLDSVPVQEQQIDFASEEIAEVEQHTEQNLYFDGEITASNFAVRSSAQVDAWAARIDTLRIGGLMRLFLLHSECTQHGAELQLRVASSQKHLDSPRNREQLRQVLSGSFGQELEVHVAFVEETPTSPQAIQDRINQARRRYAEQMLKQDPQLSQLCQQFDAYWLPDSLEVN